MQIMIRPANIEDAADIARIRIATWRAAYAGIIAQAVLDAFDFERETVHWQEVLSRMGAEQASAAAGTAWVAEIDLQGTVAGYCFCGPERSQDGEYDAEIYALYVLPEHQGRGIGRALVWAAVERLLKQSHRRMVIYVLKDNQPARRFYVALGGMAAREKTEDVRGNLMTEIGYGYDLRQMIPYSD